MRICRATPGPQAAAFCVREPCKGCVIEVLVLLQSWCLSSHPPLSSLALRDPPGDTALPALPLSAPQFRDPPNWDLRAGLQLATAVHQQPATHLTFGEEAKPPVIQGVGAVGGGAWLLEIARLSPQLLVFMMPRSCITGPRA